MPVEDLLHFGVCNSSNYGWMRCNPNSLFTQNTNLIECSSIRVEMVEELLLQILHKSECFWWHLQQLCDSEHIIWITWKSYIPSLNYDLCVYSLSSYVLPSNRTMFLKPWDIGFKCPIALKFHRGHGMSNVEMSVSVQNVTIISMA